MLSVLERLEVFLVLLQERAGLFELSIKIFGGLLRVRLLLLPLVSLLLALLDLFLNLLELGIVLEI